jgi:4-hydroxy-tetrahydrodipicolinate synthase
LRFAQQKYRRYIAGKGKTLVKAHKFTGIITPVLTPFNDDGTIAEDLFFDHCRQVLHDGSDYISPFGTSGEALSISIAERMSLLGKIVATGVARPGQLMPGTGLCSLGDTLQLTRHAVDLHAAAVMTLPPFFYPDPGDDGLALYFARLIEKTASKALRICLYHIPQNAGVGISPSLAARLNEQYPDTVVAYKDSSGNWENTTAVLAQAPGISVFPASEIILPEAMKLGAGGCISASCNVNVAQIKKVFDLCEIGDWRGVEQEMPRLTAIRNALQSAGLIPALKSIKAAQTGDKRWLNLRAPLLNADPAIGQQLIKIIGGQ